jgi:hypothetical protein
MTFLRYVDQQPGPGPHSTSWPECLLPTVSGMLDDLDHPPDDAANGQGPKPL